MSKTFRKDPFTHETVPQKSNKPYKLNRVKSWKIRDSVQYRNNKQEDEVHFQLQEELDLMTKEVDEQTNS